MYTDFRPTPLQHYIFPAGGDGVYLVVDEEVCINLTSRGEGCISVFSMSLC